MQNRSVKEWHRAYDGRIAGTVRWKEWRLRLLYKKIHAQYPHIVMHYCKGKLLTLVNNNTRRHIQVRNLQEWEAQREDFL